MTAPPRPAQPWTWGPHCAHCKWMRLFYLGTCIGVWPSRHAASKYVRTHPAGPDRRQP